MASDRLPKALSARLGRVSGTNGDLMSLNIGRTVETGLPILDAVTGVPVGLGSLVEFVGISSSGKTKALHAIAAHALTVRPCRGGLPRVCWFDLNDALDIRLIADLLRQRMDDPTDTNVRAVLASMLVYKPDCTAAMSESISQLPAFLRTSSGNDIDTVIVDALGSFYYADKYNSDRLAKLGELPIEFVLQDVIRKLLDTKKVVVYVSKCALFESETLQIPWPFKGAGVPDCPRDFMPDAWKRMVSHVVLFYHIEPGNKREQEHTTRRGIILMTNPNTSHRGQRILTVKAASILNISDDDVSCKPDQIHIA